MSTSAPVRDGILVTPGCQLAVHGDGKSSYFPVPGAKGIEKLEGGQVARSSRGTPGSCSLGSRTVHGESCRGHLACMGGTCGRSLSHQSSGHDSSSVHCTSDCLQLLGALHVRVPLARAPASDLLCRESRGLVNKSSLHCKSDCLCWAGQRWLKLKNRAEEQCNGRRAANVCRACLSTQNWLESGQGNVHRVRGGSVVGGEEMHNASMIGMALLQYHKAAL